MFHRSRLPIVSALLAAATAAVSAQGGLTRHDADVLQGKLDLILEHGLETRRAPLRTVITEREVNSYLQYGLQASLPSGVVEPSVQILGQGRVSGRAIVDLDAVRRDARPTGVLDPVNYLRGRVPVTATGLVSAEDGVGRFALESAAAGGVPLPKLLLQYVVSYYSRTPEDPDGISLDDPFTLPANIRAVAVEQGRAIIVQ